MVPAVTVGGIMSITVIVLDTGTRFLPHASVAFQVSVIIPPQLTGTVNVDKAEVPLKAQIP